MDPKQRNEIDKRFMEQNMIIEQLRNENAELEKAYHNKEMEFLSIKDQNNKSDQAQKTTKRDLLTKERNRHNKVLKSK